jgi:hypothetical protein
MSPSGIAASASKTRSDRIDRSRELIFSTAGVNARKLSRCSCMLRNTRCTHATFSGTGYRSVLGACESQVM